MKLLLLDIETAPHLATVWGLWNQNIHLPQIAEAGYVLCWAAKWLGSDTVMFDSVYNNAPDEMLRNIHTLLDEADAVIHYNGSKFDIPTLNKEFLIYGFAPPSPVKQIDLLRVARNQFKFPSNKLDYVAQALNLGKKTEHIGHELWIKCMANNPSAWKMMEEYNKNDVILLEKVYGKLKPWIKGHANHSLHSDDSFVCPNCGGNSYQKRGFYFTHNCKYQRYQCNGCKTWFRATKNIGKPSGEKFVYAT
ncbi:polB [Caudoviricetes sp.]|nr:polB [Caudoviricetes sp.]